MALEVPVVAWDRHTNVMLQIRYMINLIHVNYAIYSEVKNDVIRRD